MARRVGIELSASRCALVDLDLRARAGVPAAQRSFRSIAWSPDHAEAFVATLRLLRKSRIVPSRAVVALWGLSATCDHFSLPAGDDRRVRAQAVRELNMTGRLRGADTGCAVMLDRAPQPFLVARHVSVVSASLAEVRARIAPLVAADFAVEAVVTPAMALASLSRLLPGASDGGPRAYVAVNTDAIAVAIVEHGLLVYSREIDLPLPAPAGGTPDPVELVRRLAPELKRSFLACKHGSPRDVHQVSVCGDLPDLRALAAPLRTALQVEVETLDGASAAPGTAIEADVRDGAAAARVAWAAGAAGSPDVTLVPGTPRARARWPAFRALVPRVAAAIVLVVALVLAGRAVWTRAGSRNGSNAAAATKRTAAPPYVTDRAAPAGSRPAQDQPSTTRKAAAAPADPVVDSILYGPDRRLALIGHRVVGVGDRVAAGIIADIEPTAVVVRRPSGELRRVQMKTGK